MEPLRCLCAFWPLSATPTPHHPHGTTSLLCKSFACLFSLSEPVLCLVCGAWVLSILCCVYVTRNPQRLNLSPRNSYFSFSTQRRECGVIPLTTLIYWSSEVHYLFRIFKSVLCSGKTLKSISTHQYLHSLITAPSTEFCKNRVAWGHTQGKFMRVCLLKQYYHSREQLFKTIIFLFSM